MKRSNRRLPQTRAAVILFAAPLLLFTGALRAHAAIPGVSFTTVALTGQPAFGPTDSAVFTSFTGYSAMALGGGSQVLFSANVSNAAYPASYGLWAGTPGNIANIMRGGTNGPGVDGYIGPPGQFGMINSQGQYVIEAVLNSQVGYQRDGVVWTGTPGNLQVAAREGNVPPGVEPTKVYNDGDGSSSTENFFFVQLNNNNVLTFNSPLAPGVGDEGIWSGQPGQLQLIARTNHQAAGLPAGVNYFGIDSLENPSGTLAFTAELSGPGITTTNDRGIWTAINGNVQLVARHGDVVPGVAGATFGGGIPMQDRSTDSSGRVLFNSSISGPGTDSTNNYGYWYGDSSNLALLFRKGQAIPNFNGTLTDLMVAQAGVNRFIVQAKFSGPGVTTANDTAIFEGDANHLDLILREGQQAPGLAAGVLIGDLMSAGDTGNENGQMVLRVILTGTGVTTSNNAAFYLTDLNEGLHEILRTGDLFDIGGGIFKTVASANMGNSSISDNLLNDSGQFFFQARFSDNSQGLFIAQVPEPCTLVLFCLGALAIGATRRAVRPKSN